MEVHSQDKPYSTHSSSMREEELHDNSCSGDEWDTDIEETYELDSYGMSIKLIYLRVCEELGVPPINRLIKQMNTDTVDLKHYGILDRGAKALALTMAKNVTVATVNLHDNGIKTAGAVEIAKMLEINCFIVTLDLSCNTIGQEGVAAIAKMLHQNVTLKDLNLSNNKLFDDDICLLCDALTMNRHLRCLRLSGNNLGDKASAIIGSVLKANPVLESLDLSWNRIFSKGAMALTVGCKAMFSLKELNLAWNGLSDAGAVGIREILEKEDCSLRVLDITSISIGTIGAGHIGKGLKKNKSLKILRIGRNPFMSTGALMILKALLKNPESSLDELLLENVVFDKACEDALDELMKLHPNFSCKWDVIIQGGTVGPMDETETSPLEKFVQFMRNRGFRMVDMYRALAKGEELREGDFVGGLKSFNVQMRDSELRVLFHIFDENGDREINFREFSSILSFKMREREAEKRKIMLERKESNI